MRPVKIDHTQASSSGAAEARKHSKGGTWGAGAGVCLPPVQTRELPRTDRKRLSREALLSGDAVQTQTADTER